MYKFIKIFYFFLLLKKIIEVSINENKIKTVSAGQVFGNFLTSFLGGVTFATTFDASADLNNTHSLCSFESTEGAQLTIV
jgi:hypothetical protein